MSVEFKDKFIAFIDVLGFKDMIAAAEAGTGRTLTEIDEILAELEHAKNKAFFQKHGPQVCPQSSYKQRDLDFEITQVSDCAIVSAEISPAGVVNLVQHCWGSAMMLLTKGVMVRGYITRGLIHHEGNKFRGTGYHTAYAKEAGVSAFKKEADEKGTPFIEIDPSVSEFVALETDDCVRKMFGRYIKQDGDVAAIFPFQMLSHSFMIGGFGTTFDPDREIVSNDNLRKMINRIKRSVYEFVDSDNENAMRKVRHYVDALDAQLDVCDRTDEMIKLLGKPSHGR